MTKAGQSSHRELSIAVAVVALFVVGFLALMLLTPIGQKQAAREAIRSGRVDPQEYVGWFSPEEFQELKKEYQQHKSEIDSKVQAAATNAQATGTLAAPVTATMQASKAAVRAGETFELTVTIQIAPSWHIYAVNRPTGISAPTAISLELPAGVEQVGEWTFPDPLFAASARDQPTFIYANQTIFCCPVRVSSTVESGKLKIGGKLQYQACDPFSCRPPETIELHTEVQVEP